MPKPAVKSSSSPGLTFEEFRELVGKLRKVSEILARELTNHSGSKKAEKLSKECHDLSVAMWVSGVKAPKC
jgi:hypothetical protein